MKKPLIILFLGFFAFSLAQIQLKIFDERNRTPLYNAEIKCDNQILGRSDKNGEFTINNSCSNLEINAIGYRTEFTEVSSSKEILMEKSDSKVTEIQEIVLSDKSDKRALEILRKVNQNYKDNSPKSLDSYSFKSYDKIFMDIDEDSLVVVKQFLEANANKKIKDSLGNDDSFILKNKAFLWERAQEFLYSSQYGEKINILDNRISGLKQPIYELISFQSNRNTIPRQLKEENRGLYRFFLTDTIEIDNRETYVIRFREVTDKSPKNKRKFNGFIYVDAQTYGLKKIEKHSKNKSDGSISSTWKFYQGKWFLAEENIKLKMGKMSMQNHVDKDTTKHKNLELPAFAFLRSKYFDFKSPIEEKKSDFKGYTFSVKSTDGSLLDQYRTDSLSLRDRNTYVFMDSLGTKYNIDRKAGILTGLINGSIRVNKIDFALDEIINYNSYEGFRVGLKAKLNEKFHKNISPEGYFAYGFKDDKWKYGFAVDYRTSLEKNAVLRAEFSDDVMPSGEFNRRMWNFRLRMMNYGNNLNNDKYYNSKGGKLTYLNDITNGISLIVGLARYRETALFNYQFQDQGFSFENFKTQITLKFSPNSTNIMTPQGKSIVDQRYPELYFNYEQGLKMFGGDLTYGRFDMLFIHNFKTFIGTTGFRVYGGLTVGETPIWNHFTMNGLASQKSINFNLTSFLGFATLEGGKYYNDKFVNLYLTHKIPWYFKSFGQNVSNFDLVWRGAIGNMKNPEYHDFDFQKLDHLYQEVGLEWNNFLSSYFNLGLFYRVGHYISPKFRENFAIQFKLKLLEF